MKVHRRGFLKAAGLTIVGIAAKPILHVFSRVGISEASQTVRNKAGKRWAMVVDVKKCTEKDRCTDCIDACHRTHNVPNLGNPKDEIKWIWTVTYEKAFPEQEHEFIKKGLRSKPVIVLCNHCENPPCVRVCPTKATWQREDGIVMMDYHRCIGCRYCMIACPYNARFFNFKENPDWPNKDYPKRSHGVVESCNFCAHRVDQGMKPACVEACEKSGNGAILFGNLNDRDSDISRKIAATPVKRIREDLGTEPKVYYIGL